MVPTLLGQSPLPTRAIRFALVGGAVFVAGLALLTLLVTGLGLAPVPAGLICTALSLQANFLLSRRITWADRTGGLRRQWARFHAARAGAVIANQAVYAALVVAGVPFLLSSIVTTAAAAVANYAVADRLVFRTGR